MIPIPTPQLQLLESCRLLLLTFLASYPAMFSSTWAFSFEQHFRPLTGEVPEAGADLQPAERRQLRHGGRFARALQGGQDHQDIGSQRREAGALPLPGESHITRRPVTTLPFKVFSPTITLVMAAMHSAAVLMQPSRSPIDSR